MCAVRGTGRTLDFAIQEARDAKRPLYLLFVRVLPAITEEDFKRKWQDDPDARRIFSYAFDNASAHPVMPCYTAASFPKKSIS